MIEEIGVGEIAMRLVLTLLAGGLVGLDRGQRGRAAGLRTTILVCLAASATMIQVNLLLGMRHRPEDSYIDLDLMRLPLGVLSGIGFIGGGAILRRGSRITGVTTAATLWFVSVMGLCLGGGQIGLGMALLVICLIVLKALKSFEYRIQRELYAHLHLTIHPDSLDEDELRSRLAKEKFRVVALTLKSVNTREKSYRRYEMRVKCRKGHSRQRTPEFITELSRHPGVKRLSWSPEIRS